MESAREGGWRTRGKRGRADNKGHGEMAGSILAERGREGGKGRMVEGRVGGDFGRGK